MPDRLLLDNTEVAVKLFVAEEVDEIQIDEMLKREYEINR